tara:strand:- start:969 stop:3836 length:2868 start_codon:yes stop_codon:yes gene_type:complete
MPVTYQPPGFNKAFYISPAPFIDISKEYQKMDNGEIIGVQYSITLKGTLIADKGSPRHKIFKSAIIPPLPPDDFDTDKDILAGRVHEVDGENVVPMGASATGLPGLQFVSTEDVVAGMDPDATEPKAMSPSQWYLALQRKQIALMNLFSKETEGGELVITSPGAGGATGWKCYPRINSVDFPGHNPGQPNITEFTINLEADYMVGPDGTNDLDDFRHLEGVAGRSTRWLVKGANENWEIEESDHYAIRGIGKDPYPRVGGRSAIYDSSSAPTVSRNDTDDDGIGDVIQAFDKVYVLTHTMSATGKPKFSDGVGVHWAPTGATESECSEAGGTWTAEGCTGAVGTKSIPEAARLQPDGFKKQYAQDKSGNTTGEAWQQARGFIYDVIGYQRARRFTEGDDLTATNSVSDPTFGESFNDFDFLGLNIPVDSDSTPFENYKGFNYNRTQSVDKSSGLFSITETWVLAPEGNKVVQTFDFSIGDTIDGLIEVSVNGSIQGLNDIFASFATQADEGHVDFVEENFRDEFNALSQPSPEMDITDDMTPLDSSDSTVAAKLKNSRYENAEIHYNEIHGMLYRVAENYVNRLRKYNNYDKTTQNFTGTPPVSSRTNVDGKGYKWGIKLNPKAISSSVSMQPSTGIITYDLSFNNRKTNYIPYALSEDIDISDTYPGQVFGSTQVIGRAAGPVLQNMGTQTQWERSLSISCQVDVHNYYIVDDIEYGMANQTTSSAGVISGEDFDDDADGLSAEKAVKNVNRSNDEHRATSKTPNYALNHESLSADHKGDDVGKRNTTNAKDVDGDSTGWKVGATDADGYILGSNTTRNMLAQGLSNFNTSEASRSFISNNMVKSPSQVPAQFEAIREIINAYRPLPGIEGVTKVFMNAPSENWNPKTGSWSFGLSWVYEVTTDVFGGSYTKYGYDSSNNKLYHNRDRNPYPGGTWDGRPEATTIMTEPPPEEE